MQAKIFNVVKYSRKLIFRPWDRTPPVFVGEELFHCRFSLRQGPHALYAFSTQRISGDFRYWTV